jgi:hypothetical protein
MKKIRIITKSIGIISLTLLISSCQSLFNDENIKSNPNAVTDVDIPTLLSGTLVGAANLHEDTDVRIASLWAGELSGLSRQHQGYAQYIVQASTFDWSTLYPVASQARLIQQKADAQKDKWSKGVGQVIEALLIEKATDLYGDVPYSQAFEPVKYPTPTYDKQVDVYTSLIALLTDAASNLSAPTGLPLATGDFIYGGDVAKWKGAANTLKARLYLHLGDYANAITAANAGISSTANDFLIPHGTSVGVDDNQNYDFFVVNRKGDTGFDGSFLATLFTDRFNSGNVKTNDSALYKFYINVGGLTGVGALDPNTVDGAFAIDASYPILTYYENQLILAEAYARASSPDLNSSVTALNSVRSGLNGGYLNGLTLPSKGRLYSAYALSDFDPAGIANPKNYSDQQSALLYEIISQRYLIFVMHYEAFNDVRRLAKATPVIQLAIPIIQGTKPPERFIYPQNELNTNPNTPNPAPDQFTKLPIYL